MAGFNVQYAMLLRQVEEKEAVLQDLQHQEAALNAQIDRLRYHMVAAAHANNNRAGMQAGQIAQARAAAEQQRRNEQAAAEGEKRLRRTLVPVMLDEDTPAVRRIARELAELDEIVQATYTLRANYHAKGENPPPWTELLHSFVGPLPSLIEIDRIDETTNHSETVASYLERLGTSNLHEQVMAMRSDVAGAMEEYNKLKVIVNGYMERHSDGFAWVREALAG